VAIETIIEHTEPDPERDDAALQPLEHPVMAKEIRDTSRTITPSTLFSL
jgi:hypothetical protein